MKGLSNPTPTHKVRSEFLAMLWFAHLMPAEQIDLVFDNKLKELDAFLKLFDDFPPRQFGATPPGAQFVAGFGQFIASSLKAYIEEHRDMLTQRDKDKVKAVGE